MRRVQTGTYCGAALRQFINSRKALANRPLGDVELSDECRHFLAEGDRRGVHHMGAPGLDQLVVPRGQFGQPAGQLGQSRKQLTVDRLGSGNVHRCGEAVVGALRAIDVVVGMHGRLAATLATGQLVGATGDDLVDVHVALRAATGLPDHQRKLVVVLGMQNLVGGLFDQSRDVGRQVADAVVDPGCRLLDQRQRMQHLDRHALGTDCEIAQRTLRLGTPVSLLRYFDLPQAVGFYTRHAMLLLDIAGLGRLAVPAVP